MHGYRDMQFCSWWNIQMCHQPGCWWLQWGKGTPRRGEGTPLAVGHDSVELELKYQSSLQSTTYTLTYANPSRTYPDRGSVLCQNLGHSPGPKLFDTYRKIRLQVGILAHVKRGQHPRSGLMVHTSRKHALFLP